MKTLRNFIAGLPAALWIALFLCAPLALIALTSFFPNVSSQAPEALTPTLHHYRRALAAPFDAVLWQSLTLSAIATTLCLFVAFPVAWFLARRPSSSRGFWMALFLTPFLLNFLVRVYAWFVLLRPEGLIASLLSHIGINTSLTSSRGAVVLGLVYCYLPFLVLPLFAVLEKLDTRLLEAARDLGAGPIDRLRHVVLPHARPGIIAGLVLVFVPMMGEYCVPRMLGGGMISTLGTQIESQFLGSVKPNWPFGSALSMLLMVFVGAALIVGMRFGARLLEPENVGAQVKP